MGARECRGDTTQDCYNASRSHACVVNDCCAYSSVRHRWRQGCGQLKVLAGRQCVPLAFLNSLCQWAVRADSPQAFQRKGVRCRRLRCYHCGLQTHTFARRGRHSQVTTAIPLAHARGSRKATPPSYVLECLFLQTNHTTCLQQHCPPTHNSRPMHTPRRYRAILHGAKHGRAVATAWRRRKRRRRLHQAPQTQQRAP